MLRAVQQRRLGIEIPDYSTLCRRSRLLRKKLRIPKAASTQPIHLMIDSTGLRIHVGTARKPPKLRAWRKLHIAVDRETGNIVASELTASRDVVSALEVAPQEAADSESREHSTHPPDDR